MESKRQTVCSNFNKNGECRKISFCNLSPEGLCMVCEIKTYPERYNGCGCCGKVVRYDFFCLICERGLSKWLFDLFYNKNTDSKSTTCMFATPTENETNDWKLWTTISHGIHSIINSRESKHPVKYLIECAVTDEWPGFHIGDDKYIKQNAFTLKSIINISDIKWENVSIIMLRELTKIGIHLYEVIQMPQIIVQNN